MPAGEETADAGPSTHRLGVGAREKLAADIFAFSDKDGSFLEKIGECLEAYEVKRPAVTVVYKVSAAWCGGMAL